MIKFRVWSKTLGKYRQLDEASNDQGLGMLFEVKNGIGSNVTSICCSVGDVVEQFTGLKDRNGKDIYEGDILAWHSNIYRKQDWVGLVQYRGAGFVVQDDPKEFSTSTWLEAACSKGANILEIVGNIHENPELLEESNE